MCDRTGSLVLNTIGEGGNLQSHVGHRKEIITGGDPFGLISWDSW